MSAIYRACGRAEENCKHMAELDVYCPKCGESRGRRIGDRIVCVACGYEKTLEWVQGQQEGF